MTTLPDITELNQLSFEEFNNAISVLFEPVQPLAEALYSQRPFFNYRQLLENAKQVFSKLSLEQRIILVNAHPKLGETRLSAMSEMEQSKLKGNGVDEQLALLNTLYQDKHGFKFITFVNGRSRRDILPEIESRIGNKTELELERGDYR